MLRRARQGDRQSFLALLHRYDPRLRRLTLRLLADPQRLDRVLNRAYMKAWRSLPFLHNGEPAAKWLYRVVYNACINEMRWEPDRPPPPPLAGPRTVLPAAPVERRLTALRALKPNERIALVLVDGEGFSLDAASGVMRRDSADVAVDLHEARTRWRSYVLDEPLPEEAEIAPANESTPEPASNGDNDPYASIGPAPLEIRTALGRLAGPIAPREPGGHVKLLSAGRDKGGLRPRAASRRTQPQPPVRSRTEPTEDGDEHVEQLRIVRPDSPRTPEVTETAEAEAENKAAQSSGAGARRKRRRDAKRRSRTGTPSRSGTSVKPEGDER